MHSTLNEEKRGWPNSSVDAAGDHLAGGSFMEKALFLRRFPNVTPSASVV